MKKITAKSVLFGSSIHYQAYYLCRFNLAAIIPLLITTIGLTHSEAGALNSIIFVAYAIALFPAGILGDWIGPRKVITIGAIVSLTMNVLFSYAPTFQSMVVLQFMNGLGQGMAWGPLTRLMANWYSSKRMSFVMSMLSIPASLGPLAAFILAGYLASNYGWSSAFQIPALILVATSVIFLVLVRDRPLNSRQDSSSKRNSIVVLKNREIWLIGASYFALFGVIRGLLSWLPTFLVEQMHMTLLNASVVGGLLSLPGIATMFLGTWVSDAKLGGRKKPVIAASLLTPIPLLLLLPVIHNGSIVLLMVAILLALFNTSAGLYFAYPASLLPKDQVGAAAGLIDMLGYVGIFLISLTIGVVVDAFKSYDPVFLVLVGMAMFGVATVMKFESN